MFRTIAIAVCVGILAANFFMKASNNQLEEILRILKYLVIIALCGFAIYRLVILIIYIISNYGKEIGIIFGIGGAMVGVISIWGIIYYLYKYTCNIGGFKGIWEHIKDNSKEKQKLSSETKEAKLEREKLKAGKKGF